MACLFPPRESRRIDLDKILGGIDTSLSLLMEVTDYIPVAGANKIVPIAQSVVLMIQVSGLEATVSPHRFVVLLRRLLQKTRSNDSAALELSQEVLDLVELVETTTKQVKDKIQSIQAAIHANIESRFKPEQFDAGINQLVRYYFVSPHIHFKKLTN